MELLGNISLLDQPKHGFLCSRCTKSSVILPCLDWAVEYSKGTIPVISTFHSEIEEAVLDILLKGICPIILVLGRKQYKRIPEKLQTAFDNNRLLIVSVNNQNRINRESALSANRYVCEQSHDITFGFISPNSSLYSLYEETKVTKKTKVLIEF
jgi:hypothetical protein